MMMRLMMRRLSSIGAEAPKRRRALRPQKALLTLTPGAVGRMKELLRNQPGEVTGIRLGVRSRGCNGKSYTMGYASGKQSGEEVVEQDGVKVFVDSRAIMFVVGTVVDFVEDHLKSEFVFMNPNAKGSCGCGESFNV